MIQQSIKNLVTVEIFIQVEETVLEKSKNSPSPPMNRGKLVFSSSLFEDVHGEVVWKGWRGRGTKVSLEWMNFLKIEKINLRWGEPWSLDKQANEVSGK